MKKILFFLLLFPACLLAQREVKLDTTWLENAGGKWLKVSRVVYLNDEETLTKVLVGDTSRLVQNQIDRIILSAQSMANDARTVSTFRRRLNDLIRESNAIRTASGVSPIDTVQRRYVGKFLQAGWTIRESGTITPITFNVNAQGRLRYTVQGQSARNADLFGDVLTLNAYPSPGNQVELYMNSERNYMSLDRSVVVREPGSSANLTGNANRGVTPAHESKSKTTPARTKNLKSKN